MLRGYQKRVVILKDTGSKIFEEAQFVLKEDFSNASDFDIVSEATRLVNDTSIKIKKPTLPKNTSKILRFSLGVLLGVLLSVVLYLTII
jgi:hypothetical protein